MLSTAYERQNTDAALQHTGHESLVEKRILHKLNFAAAEIHMDLAERNLMSATSAAHRFSRPTCLPHLPHLPRPPCLPCLSCLSLSLSRLSPTSASLCLSNLVRSELAQPVSPTIWSTRAADVRTGIGFACKHSRYVVITVCFNVYIVQFECHTPYNSLSARAPLPRSHCVHLGLHTTTQVPLNGLRMTVRTTTSILLHVYAHHDRIVTASP